MVTIEVEVDHLPMTILTNEYGLKAIDSDTTEVPDRQPDRVTADS